MDKNGEMNITTIVIIVQVILALAVTIGVICAIGFGIGYLQEHGLKAIIETIWNGANSTA